ncbi:MAG: hypothetical protein WB616_01440 [Candidatus Sulfotelmatobacter sp.]
MHGWRSTVQNTVREAKSHLFLAIAEKFWAPVPWMLEATIALETILGKRPEAVIIGLLLIFNAGLGLVQEKRAHNALTLLRKRLPVQARVRHSGQWQSVAAEELVPGDFVHVRMGDLMPADVRLAEGHILLDQSTLTGESLPIDAGPDRTAIAGSVVVRGEGSGEVIATGGRTFFGKTAELVRTAKTVSHLQTIIFTIVKYLVMLDGVSRFHPSCIFPVCALANGGNAILRRHVAGSFDPSASAGHLHSGDGAWFSGTCRQRRTGDTSLRH